MNYAILFVLILFTVSSGATNPVIPPPGGVFPQISRIDSFESSAYWTLQAGMRAGTEEALLRTQPLDDLFIEMIEVAHQELEENHKEISSVKEIIEGKYSAQVNQKLEQIYEASDRKEVFLLDILRLVGDVGPLAQKENALLSAMLVSEILFSLAYQKYPDSKEMKSWVRDKKIWNSGQWIEHTSFNGEVMLLAAWGNQETYDWFYRASQRPGWSGLMRPAMQLMTRFDPTINTKVGLPRILSRASEAIKKSCEKLLREK